MECIEGGNLYQWIKHNLHASEQVLKSIFLKVCQTLELIQSRGIVHRDIKLENILVQYPSHQVQIGSSTSQDPYNIQPKLIDFGLSTVLTQDEWVTETSGTLAFCSPEIVANHPHSFSTDIWSLGIVLYTMLTKRMPFVSQTWEQTIFNIRYKNINFNQPCWQGVSYQAKDLVTKMLHKNPY